MHLVHTYVNHSQKVFRSILLDCPLALAELETKDGGFNVTDFGGVTPLCFAVLLGRLHIAQYLVSRGCSLDEPSILGLYAIHYAAIGQRKNILEWLLSLRPCALSTRDIIGRTANDIAREFKCDITLAWIVEHKATKRELICESINTITSGVSTNNIDTIERPYVRGLMYILLDKPDRLQQLSTEDTRGDIPLLHIAMFHGSVQAVQILTSMGHNLNEKCKHGMFPLDYAECRH